MAKARSDDGAKAVDIGSVVQQFREALIRLRLKVQVEVFAQIHRDHPEATEDDIVKELASPLRADPLTDEQRLVLEAMTPVALEVGRGSWAAVNQPLAEKASALAAAADSLRLDPGPADRLAVALGATFSSSVCPTPEVLRLAYDVDVLATRVARAAARIAAERQGAETPPDRDERERVLDDLDRRIVRVAKESHPGWIKSGLPLFDKCATVAAKFGLSRPTGRENTGAWRSRVARLIPQYLERNKPHGKLVRWAGKEPPGTANKP